MKIIALLGEPGAGKSTMMKALLKKLEITPEHMKRFGKLTDAHQKDNYYVLGKYEKDEKFPGTDKLSTAVQKDVTELLSTWPKDSVVLFEGDRLCTASFLEYCNDNFDLHVFYLETSNEERERRYAERGSNQNKTWLKGRESKVRNILSNFMLMDNITHLKNDDKKDFKANFETIMKVIEEN